MAVTGIDGHSRTSDEAAERPTLARYDQKLAKYGRFAEQNSFRSIPGVFSHTNQIHVEFKILVKEQSRHKLISFEGEAKSSKVRSIMKSWSKCMSMAIAKTASRNVAFKVAKMREAIMEDQDEFLMRNSEHTDVGVEANNRAQLEDVAQNADLYIANQEANTQP